MTTLALTPHPPRDDGLLEHIGGSTLPQRAQGFGRGVPFLLLPKGPAAKLALGL